MSLKEFFGFGGYTRDAEGYLSAEHLIFVTTLICIMIICAVFIGKSKRKVTDKKKNNVLIFTAISIDLLELFKIVLLSVRENNALHFLNELPLFLCSIQLIAIPLAAFSKGRLKQASLDFVVIFGLLGAVMGTYFAGNNYSCYPVLSFDNVISGITHTISGFASLYILISDMCSMKKKNIVITTAILFGFSVAAYVANIFTNCNYMFLLRGDGTPYDLVFSFVNGNKVLYPLCVVGLFVVYIALYYAIYYAVTKKESQKVLPEEIKEEVKV